jgi:hypothetical protein
MPSAELTGALNLLKRKEAVPQHVRSPPLGTKISRRASRYLLTTPVRSA